MIEEQEYLHYGDKVALKCLFNQMYISLNFNENLVEASGYHPILYVSILIIHFIKMFQRMRLNKVKEKS